MSGEISVDVTVDVTGVDVDVTGVDVTGIIKCVV
jgi:hypothetical protein